MKYIEEPGIRELSIGSIIRETEKSPFCISYGFDLAIMIGSLSEVGLINPVIVTRCQEKGKYRVVCGHKRLLAAHELGWEKIWCRIFSFDSELNGLFFSLHDNLATRQLNPVEKAWVLSKMEKHLNWEQIKEQVMPLLGLPAHKGTFELYRDMWVRFDDNLKRMAARGDISIQNAKRILGLDDRDIIEISKLFSNIRFNLNQQAQLIELLTDISLIKKSNFSELLGMEEIKKAMLDPGITSARRAEAIINQLKRIRNPMAEAAWEKMKRKMSSLSLPEGVRLNVPPYFEGSRYSMDILFKDGGELLAKLNELLKNQSLTQIRQPIEEAANH